MSMKRITGGAATSLSTYKRFANGAWQTLTIAKRYDGAQWVNLLPESSEDTTPSVAIYEKTYSLSSAQIYWGSGNQDNQSSSTGDLIQGSYGASSATTRRTLLFFPISQIMEDLQGAQIVSCELYLKRLSTSHGTASAYCRVKTHAYTSEPATWTGSDTGHADSGTPSFTRGQGKYITLLSSVAEGMRDGTVKGLALDADSNYQLASYARFARSGTKLRITFTKEEEI